MPGSDEKPGKSKRNLQTKRKLMQKSFFPSISCEKKTMNRLTRGFLDTRHGGYQRIQQHI